jgi:hypothetical protein
MEPYLKTTRVCEGHVKITRVYERKYHTCNTRVQDRVLVITRQPIILACPATTTTISEQDVVMGVPPAGAAADDKEIVHMQEADDDDHGADNAPAEETMAATSLSHSFPNRPVIHSFSPVAE